MVRLDRARSARVRAFLSLMKGASASDWWMMMNFNKLRRSVYVYNHDRRMVTYADKQLEWPIVWVLARYHQKHVFYSKKKPSIKTLNDQLINFEKESKMEMVLQG